MPPSEENVVPQGDRVVGPAPETLPSPTRRPNPTRSDATERFGFLRQDTKTTQAHGLQPVGFFFV